MLYINDFLAHRRVKLMDNDQFAWFMRMLMEAWKAEPACCLLNEDTELMIAAGCNDKELWDRKKFLVLSCWKAAEDPKYLTNDRLTTEYNRMCEISDKRKSAANARRSGANAQQMQPEVQQVRATPTLTLTPTPTRSINPPRDSDLLVEELLKLHPRRGAKIEDERGCVNALMREVAKRGEAAAFEYLRGRTELYRKKTADWPPGQEKFIKRAGEWYEAAFYDEEEKFWERGTVTNKSLKAIENAFK